jgi:ubiquinone/menaquinone biosynthesis C-methylase UbiE
VTDPVEVVRAGYDAMAQRYLTWSAKIVDDPRMQYLDELMRRLPDGSDVVDLGCGAGIPNTALLAERHQVLGIDISGEQLRLARQHVPNARFEQADIATLDLPGGSCDAVTAAYSLIHVPREMLTAVLARIHRWLRPDGWLLATFSASGSSDGIQDDFLGVPMFFSGYDADTNRELVVAAGFELVQHEVVTIHEPDGPAGFLWLLARATSGTRATS